jgi:hypothetical protein
MPICARCGIVCLDEEAHHCVPKSRQFSATAMAIGGAISGAIAGFAVWTWICLRFNTSVIGIHCLLWGVWYGVPLGVAVGGVLAVTLHKNLQQDDSK